MQPDQPRRLLRVMGPLGRRLRKCCWPTHPYKGGLRHGYSRVFFYDFFTTTESLPAVLHVLEGLSGRLDDGALRAALPPYQTHELTRAWHAVGAVEAADKGRAQFRTGMAHAAMAALALQAAASPWSAA